MTAYYNENDPKAVHVLKEQIRRGVIAPGFVDDRSIKHVMPEDLKGFTQCHFFAGGGFWSVAARMAGWSDGRPIWSASCPCQPFSQAGNGGGADDPRHLWPDLYRIIRGARLAGFGPTVLVGEQVAGKAGYNWFDRVRLDLARESYSARSIDFAACAVNAPHQRNRQYWAALADAESVGSWSGLREIGSVENRAIAANVVGFDVFGALVDTARIGWVEGIAKSEIFERGSAATGTDAPSVMADGAGVGSEMAGDAYGVGGTGSGRAFDRGSGSDDNDGGALDHAERSGRQGFGGDVDRSGGTGVGSIAPRPVATSNDSDMADRDGERSNQDGRSERAYAGNPGAIGAVDGAVLFGGSAGTNGDMGDMAYRDGGVEHTGRPDETRGATGPHDSEGFKFSGAEFANAYGASAFAVAYWADAEWIVCHDRKARRTKPGLRFLVNGLPGRVDLWSIGGNAIVPQAAALVIEALKEVLDDA